MNVPVLVDVITCVITLMGLSVVIVIQAICLIIQMEPHAKVT